MKHYLPFKALLLAGALCIGAAAQAQYYSLSRTYNPGNPGGLNTDPDFDNTTFAPPTGSTVLINYPYAKNYTLQYTPVQTIPFTFNFNGSPVTQYKICTSGYITFTTSASTPVGTPNTALPNASLPNNTICCWGFGGAGLGGQIYTKVYGTSPNRQLWIGFWFAGNPTDTNSQNMWAIVLEETTNNIYVVDEWGINNVDCACPYNPLNLTVGVQINSTTAYQVSGSPNIHALTANSNYTDNNYYEFIYGTQPTYNAEVVNSNINPVKYYGKGMPYPVTAGVYNSGSSTLTSFNLRYTVNGGPVQTDVVSSASIATSNVSNITHTINWTPPTSGTYNMKIWVDSLDGNNPVSTPSKDTLNIKNIVVIDSVVTKMVMFEEFMQASCNPCMYAAPNLDSVLVNNQAYCNPVRYHVSWPGVDYINTVTQTPDVNPRVTYYSVSGVPDARIDGSIDVAPGSVASADIQNEYIIGSPFKINVTSCTYNPGNGQYSLTASITAYESFASGLIAQAVLTVDTVTYLADQSTEDPKSSFAPPLGTGTNPDSYYQYVMSFPQVVEDLMPSASGTTMGAFTSGVPQVLNVSWTKNHPWGSSPKTYKYDSTGTHITVFIQNNTSKYIYQSAKVVPSTLPTGVNEITDVDYLQIYPNPTNGNANVAFSLAQGQNVTVDVYNMLGERVTSINQGKMASGQHLVTINGANLNSGVYFVRFTTDNGSVTKRLVIQK